MRVAYVCADPGVPVFGRKGSSVHVQEVVGALLRRGAAVSLFAARLDGEPAPALARVRVHALPAPASREPAARERQALAANVDLDAALRAAGPFDLVYERYSLWSFAGMEFARAAGLPGVLEVNAPLVDEQAAHRSLVDRAGAERVAARAFAAATGIVAVSSEVAAYVRTFPDVRERVHVVPNGVDPARFRACAPAWSPAGPSRYAVGFVGTLKPWHGLPLLVEAFALLRESGADDARLLVVGDGPERSTLLELLARRGVGDATVLAGAVAPQAIPAWLASMDVGVAPYPRASGFYFSPLKVYEYMAAARPVVASRVGQLARLVEHGVTGLLCPPGDAAALAAALTRLYRDPLERARMGRAGRELVLREHTWDAVAERILRVAGLDAPAVPAQAGRA